MLVSWVLRAFITSTKQHPESSEMSHDITNGILRSKSIASAGKTLPEAEDPETSGGNPGCVIGS